MTQLSVNVNKIALLRNARDIGIPSVVGAASICVEAGSHGITVHPRPDMRHIRPSDVYDLAQTLSVEFNIEGNPLAGPQGGEGEGEGEGEKYPGFMQIVRQVRPDQCTLVPDDPGQSTSDHGWDLARDAGRVGPLIEQLKADGIRVSLFMDAEADNMRLAADIGADRVELYTEPYASAFAAGKGQEALKPFAAAAAAAQDCGLGVNAGHDLNVMNLGLFCRIPGILEVSIGHALIAEALEAGLAATVKAYLAVLGK